MIRRSLLLAVAGILARAARAQTLTVTQQLGPVNDVFLTPAASYTLSKLPSAVPAIVTLNGLRMLQGVDYTITGQVLSWIGQDVAGMDSPVVQVLYWSAA